MTKTEQQIHPPIAGLAALPDYIRARNTATEILEKLAASGAITRSQIRSNLDEITAVIKASNSRQERYWKTVYAQVNAAKSHPGRQDDAAKYKDQLFQWLDENMSKYRRRLDDAAREAVEKRVVPRGFDWVRKRISDWNKEQQ